MVSAGTSRDPIEPGGEIFGGSTFCGIPTVLWGEREKTRETPVGEGEGLTETSSRTILESEIPERGGGGVGHEGETGIGGGGGIDQTAVGVVRGRMMEAGG